MKKVLSIVAVAACLSVAFVSCGPSKEEIEATEKKKTDSIAAVEKAKQDSIAAADALAAQAKEAADEHERQKVQEKTDYQFYNQHLTYYQTLLFSCLLVQNKFKIELLNIGKILILYKLVYILKVKLRLMEFKIF